ncbi:MFS transporter [Clostridium chromiireducens]|uniref:MFS transporter n=1 Tax=Clostridium chromiireducens TaxID=225345 RepID=UPI003AF58D58
MNVDLKTEQFSAINTRQKISEQWIPWIIFFSITVNVSTVYMTLPIMGVLSKNFLVPMDRISVAMSLIALMYAFSFVLYGSLSDKYGRRRFLLFGAISLSLITVGISFTTNFSTFLLLTSIQGIAAGAIPSVAIPYMADITPKERIGRAMGIALSGTVAGTVMGRGLSGVIAQFLNWEAVYIIYGGLLILMFILLMLLPNKDKCDKEISILTMLKNTGSLMCNKRIFPLLLIGGGLFFSYLGTATFLTPYLSSPPFELSPALIGMLSLVGVVGIFISPIAGNFVSKYGSYKIMLTGIGTVIISIQIMAYIPSVISVLIGTILLYAGVFICQPAVLSIVTTVVDAKYRGSASSLYLLACMAGGSIGAFALRSIYNSHKWIGVTTVSSLVCCLVIFLSIGYASKYRKSK